MTRLRLRARPAIALFVLSVSLLACATDSPDSGPAVAVDPGESVNNAAAGVEPNARVSRIVDGDTIVVEISGREERVRLIGIDTPESVIPNTPPECFGPESSARISELIPPGTDILIERDIEPRDRFDRLLGYVYRAADGLFVNLSMASDGYADTLSIAPNTTHAAAIGAATAAARSQGLGLWGACNPS